MNWLKRQIRIWKGLCPTCPTNKPNQGYCSKCLGLDDESCDCEHCNGTGLEPTKEEWESRNKPEWEEQAEAVGKVIYNMGAGKMDKELAMASAVENISDLLKQQKQKLVGKIEKMKKEMVNERKDIGGVYWGQISGYNEALSDIISLIQEEDGS